MAKSEAQKRADAKYNKKAYDRMGFCLRKDANLNVEFLRAYAENRGESLNGFIIRAITETIEQGSATR